MEKTARTQPREVLRLLPLLALYSIWVFWKAKQGFQWDEGRYVLNAQNLLKGYFASEETLLFWNGPGYPIYLVPFVALKAPLLLAKLGNAVFLWLGVAYFLGSLRRLGIGPARLAYAYALGIFLLLHGSLIEFLMTESLSAFLVSGALFHYLAASRDAAKPRRHVAAAAAYLGYLALTKVFFGYVLAFGLLFSMGWIILNRIRGAAWQPGGAYRAASSAAALACAVGLVLCIPWLAYTQAKTGKFFFWSNSGGSQLYCMTLPEKELVGDWLNFEEVIYFPEFFPGQAPFYRELAGMDYLRRDEEFKRAALANLRAHPGKVFRNWRANVNRMVFGYPVSRYPGSDPELATGNRSFIYALPFFLIAFAAWPAWKRRRQIPAGAWVALAFAGLAFGGMSFLSSIPRMVFPLLPAMGLWLAAVATARQGPAHP